jgi:uncharacterized phiE125 gp8 family phage protein
MRVKQLTTPALPITLAAVKDHLRIEQSETIYDSELTSLIRTAQEWIFATCHLTLTNTDYKVFFNEFPCESEALKLPLYPILTIEEFKYFNADGNIQGPDFQVDLIQAPNAIYPAIGEVWPETQKGRINSIEIELSAGYGATESSVPELAKHLIKLLIGHWYKNREAVVTGTISKEIEIAADNLMKLLRVNEFEAFEV